MTLIKPINIGIIGLASIARKQIIPAIYSLKKHYKLKAISSKKNKDTYDFLFKQFTNFYSDYEELIEDKSLDAIYIPLPNALHYIWAKKALERGLHVLVEKPLSCSLKQTQELVEIAKLGKLVLLENFQFRFHNQLAFIKKLIKDNYLGEIRSINSAFGFPPLNGGDDIRYKKNLGGGSLLDAGSYTCKISQILMGYGLEVKAATLIKTKDYEVDIWGGAYLQDKDTGISSHLSFGFDNFYQCSLEIWGSKAKLSTRRIFTAKPDYKPEILLEDSNGVQKYKMDSDNHFKNMLLHFHKLCTSKEGYDDEYKQNIDQARLISCIESKGNLI